MTKLITINVTTPDKGDDGERVVDTFIGDRCSFFTEPSGALVIFEAENKVWAVYAAGAWLYAEYQRAEPGDAN